MNEQDMFLLSAYIDEQLDAEQREVLEDRLQHEPNLKQHLDQLLATHVQLKDAFNSIMDEPLPEGLQQLLGEDHSPSSTATVIDLPRNNNQSATITELKPRKTSWFSHALAASIALGVGVLIGVGQSEPGPETLFSQILQPSDKLVSILSSRPSGTINQLSDQSVVSVQPELSFMDHRGDFCRQYRIQSNEQAFRGIACVENQQWQNRLLVPTLYHEADPSIYQPASVYDDPVISQYIELHIQGIALGETDEQEQLDQLRF